jgi:hypothetical protein
LEALDMPVKMGYSDANNDERSQVSVIQEKKIIAEDSSEDSN